MSSVAWPSRRSRHPQPGRRRSHGGRKPSGCFIPRASKTPPITEPSTRQNCGSHLWASESGGIFGSLPGGPWGPEGESPVRFASAVRAVPWLGPPADRVVLDLARNLVLKAGIDCAACVRRLGERNTQPVQGQREQENKEFHEAVLRLVRAGIVDVSQKSHQDVHLIARLR